MNRTILFIAQGFGSGRILVAPGTFGSIVGLGWFAILVSTGSMTAYLGGTLAGLLLSIWSAGRAERILGHTDPSSVVIDEIAALPVCFLAWVGGDWLRFGQLPPVATFFSGDGWTQTLIVFGLFRLFDVWKPWPINRSQRLPGGWGVTVDDLLAGLAVASATLAWHH